MPASVHGHQVLKLIRETDQPLNKEALLASIQTSFGEATPYHTCSASDLSAEELIELFLSKGKLVLENDQIQFVGCQCQHG